ncbi:citrate lyase subunit beta/citryl-CoA lyase [Saccharopolyspora lacisalsi]|uniref:Citrate lyase subunit beta/citryl-CoA lyase n=1 Tax=Halosaccharopolyspora lacisalsi TaxID=1000566 RepID=A0A839DSM5_9PSEU|nr:CoA ester lyase [Halosaccharopolyspora lacisalsi]MBA8823960.1 citrate lyase subunit beta/citryl-CoA lyase [Halosaccharopolyspora lacisalsi]
MIRQETLAHARSMLFVPGNRPDRFAKAAVAGADAVILDLEDAVGVEDKDTARQHVAEYLRDGHPAVVRINAAGTPWYDDDVAMVARHPCAVMLPKSEHADALVEFTRLLPDTPVIPLLETATGLMSAHALCHAEGVVRAAFGNVDLAAQLGIDPGDHQALVTARSTLVLAAASAGIAPPIDGVTTSVHDDEVLVADTDHVVGLGFTGKLCIHPSQVSAIRSAFTPLPESVRWAHDVIAASDEGSVTVLDGQMIDKPVVDRARSILLRTDLS